jgi:hypothetical protein
VDLAVAVPAALDGHRSVQGVRVVGSRAEGRAHDFSDWDFAVETDDFQAVARDLPRLVAVLAPVAEQWDRYSSYACYMLMLRGPIKVDLMFPAERQEWAAPWDVSPDTLSAIDRHFWDWILWLEQKRRGGRADVLPAELAKMHELMLRPMGIETEPQSVAEALSAYLDAREALEGSFGVEVPRELEREVRPVVQPREA